MKRSLKKLFIMLAKEMLLHYPQVFLPTCKHEAKRGHSAHPIPNVLKLNCLYLLMKITIQKKTSKVKSHTESYGSLNITSAFLNFDWFSQFRYEICI